MESIAGNNNRRVGYGMLSDVYVMRGRWNNIMESSHDDFARIYEEELNAHSHDVFCFLSLCCPEKRFLLRG